MKYILATDSFKGCMSSQEVEDEIAEVLNAKGIETVCLPMSDGGDGMLAAFTAATGGTLEPVYIHDLMMRRTDAHYGVTPDGTAIVEVAQACGLSLIKEEERNPMRATTYGVGELLARAIKRGCRKFVIGLGGTATSDAGIGMIKALVDIFARGKNFDEALKTELGECRFTLACDVDNPLCGENGAAHVYGPQKGATPEMVGQLDRRARLFAEKSALHFGFDRSAEPGAGAAGGLGYAFMQYLGAEPAARHHRLRREDKGCRPYNNGRRRRRPTDAHGQVAAANTDAWAADGRARRACGWQRERHGTAAESRFHIRREHYARRNAD